MATQTGFSGQKNEGPLQRRGEAKVWERQGEETRQEVMTEEVKVEKMRGENRS